MQIRSILPLFLLAASTLFTSCLKDTCSEKRTYTVFTPVYRSAESIREGVTMEEPRELTKPGKIYVYGDHLFINERGEGLHILDNSDPSQPVNLAFLAIPGNFDLAAFGKTLYADSYMDLLAFDISAVTEPSLVFRKEDVFSSYSVQPDGQVLVDYTASRETRQFDCGQTYQDIFFEGDILLASDFAVKSDGGVSQATGIGGSTARFTLAKGFLYAVDREHLHAFGLQDPKYPQSFGKQYIGWETETIFPMADHLFIGSRSAMFIYSISDPAKPGFISQTQHLRACDPVVSDGKYAYVTLRSGTPCEGFANQLDVYDIQNVYAPVHLKTFPMTHPIGLAVREQTLFLCDDSAGLRIFDKSEVQQIGSRQLAWIQGRHAFDVIAMPQEGRILVVGNDGLAQYDASDPSQPRLLSLIPVKS